MNCLASTGVDPTIPLLIGGVALLLGMAVVFVTLRRRRGVALIYAIALPLMLGALVFGAVAPAAQAMVPVDACSSTPTGPGCTPAAKQPDMVLTSTDGWEIGTIPANTEVLPLDAASATTYNAEAAAIQALGSNGFANMLLSASAPPNSGSSVPTEFGYTGTAEAPNNAFYFHDTEFNAAVTGLDDPTVTFTVDLTYADGCGGTLSTHVTASGLYTSPPPPVP